MKHTFIGLSLSIFLWSCSSQNRETEAYLQNLAEENATLLELIQKKNQEMDQLTVQIQQLEGNLASTSSKEMLPAPGKVLSLDSAAFAHTAGKKTDSLGEGKLIAASSKKVQLTEKPVINQTNKYVQPKNLEEYLNQISDQAIDLPTRKKWRQSILLSFVNGSVQVFAEKKGFINVYTAATLLDLLVYFPHQVKVSKVSKDQNDKIIELRLQMYRQRT